MFSRSTLLSDWAFFILVALWNKNEWDEIFFNVAAVKSGPDVKKLCVQQMKPYEHKVSSAESMKQAYAGGCFGNMQADNDV